MNIKVELDLNLEKKRIELWEKHARVVNNKRENFKKFDTKIYVLGLLTLNQVKFKETIKNKKP